MSRPDDECLAFLKNASKPLALGGTVLILSSFAIAVTILSLTVSAPFVILFSPVLVPVLVTGAIVFTGVMTSAAGAGATSYWMYSFVKGNRYLVADKFLCLCWRVKTAFKVLVSARDKDRVETVVA